MSLANRFTRDWLSHRHDGQSVEPARITTQSLRALFFYQRSVALNKYEYLIKQKELCEELAGLLMKVKDFKLFAFYRNAAEGFRIRAENLKRWQVQNEEY